MEESRAIARLRYLLPVSEDDDGGREKKARGKPAARKMTLVGVAPPPPAQPLGTTPPPPRRLPPDTLEDFSPPGDRRRPSSIPAGAFGDDASPPRRPAPSALEQARGFRRRLDRHDPRPWDASPSARPSGTWPRGSAPPVQRQASAPRDLGSILEDLASLPPPKTQTGIKPPVALQNPRRPAPESAAPRSRPPRRLAPSSEPPTDKMSRLPDGVILARAREADRDVIVPREASDAGAPTAEPPVVLPSGGEPMATPRRPLEPQPEAKARPHRPAGEADFPRRAPVPLPARRLSAPEYEAVHAKTEIIRRSAPPKRRWVVPAAVLAAAVVGATVGAVGVSWPPEGRQGAENVNAEAGPDVVAPSREVRADSPSRAFNPLTVRPPAMPPRVRQLGGNARRRAAAVRREEASRLHTSGDFAEARARWVEALTFLPDDDRASEGLASSLAELGEGRLALGWAARAVELAPSDSRHREVYGRLLERAGYRERALAEYEAGLQVAPQNPQLRERVTALRTSNEH